MNFKTLPIDAESGPFVHYSEELRFLPFSPVSLLIKKKKKTQIDFFSTPERLPAAQLLSVLSSTENQFAPFKINCVQFPRMCLFHSLQMRLWTNRVTLKISIANPFLDAWQSLCTAHKVEHEKPSIYCISLWAEFNENVLKITGSAFCQAMNTRPCLMMFLLLSFRCFFIRLAEDDVTARSLRSICLYLISIPCWNPIESTLFV